MGKKFKSIKEMKQMFHCPNCNKLVLYFYKPVSVYITRILLMLPMNANFWTFMIFISTLLASVLLGYGGYEYQIAGIIALHIAFMLDVCDGEIALYRKQFSNKGKFLDYLGHGAFPLIYLALGVGIFRSTLSINYIYMAIVSMFFYTFCAHNRWAFLSILKQIGKNMDIIKKDDSPIKSITRSLTTGNFDFEVGAFLFIMIILKLDWLALYIFTVGLPIKWLVQTIIFNTDFTSKKGEKRLKPSF